MELEVALAKMKNEGWSRESIELANEKEAVVIDGRLIISTHNNRGELFLLIACDKGIGIASEKKYELELREDDSKGDFGVLSRRITHSQPTFWIGNRYRVSVRLQGDRSLIVVQS